MPQNFFIIGQPKTGKTSLLKELVKELRKNGLSVGGFISPEERHHGTRTAFYVTEVVAGKTAMLANVKGDGPKVSKYHVNVPSFESIAMPVMKTAESYDVVIIDEIGLMELKSGKFSDALDSLLESHTPIIASLQSDLVNRYGITGEIIELNDNNREQVFRELLQKTKAIKKKSVEIKIVKPTKKEKTKPTKTKTAKTTKPDKKLLKSPQINESPVEEPLEKPTHKKHSIVDKIKGLFRKS